MTAIVNTGWPTHDFTIGELTTADGQVLTDLRLRYRVSAMPGRRHRTGGFSSSMP